MLSNRLQILIDDDRQQRLVAEAARRNVPVAEVVRDAIDAFLAPDLEVKRLAWAEIRAISERDPMPVPSTVAELRAEIDESHDRFLDHDHR